MGKVDDILNRYADMVYTGYGKNKEAKAELLTLLEQAAPEKKKLPDESEASREGYGLYLDKAWNYNKGVDDYLAHIRSLFGSSQLPKLLKPLPKDFIDRRYNIE